MNGRPYIQLKMPFRHIQQDTISYYPFGEYTQNLQRKSLIPLRTEAMNHVAYEHHLMVHLETYLHRMRFSQSIMDQDHALMVTVRSYNAVEEKKLSTPMFVHPKGLQQLFLL